jgi:hypothetical protein
MKTIAVILLSALLFGSCEKNCKSMLVVRDCTGTYLRDDGKDYHVCNVGKLSKFSDGETVDATYHVISSCNSDEVVCMMLHPNQGWIEVDSVK